MDATEVTVAKYAECVEAGVCTSAHKKTKTCNGPKRAAHPVNCVTWHQANSHCAWRKARLPSEVEWEFAARGGDQLLKYPWGDAGPDGHACWKQGGTCPVASFEPGVFGLYDISGNVWEWIADGYGPYPWPPVTSPHRIYRGGSWSRRFEKWMHTRLRNWWPPGLFGSHLGFRCVLTPDPSSCPYGPAEKGQGCHRGVDKLECPDGHPFNGLRCAAPGEPPCARGQQPREGFGCVPDHAIQYTARPPDLSAVSKARSQEFDGDCEANYRGRPRAYRLSGGTHHARNLVGDQAGCKNRDVGVGWNSACCPK
jgi:hypothetical protein